ncbi:Chromosome 16 80 [Perkinsus chesapeaki]|uniref:Chromosome 16 80 n=1 Tax=Perkinsus chesapeaki TaxID=330153 RepID=A0A7J6M7Q2_PERCH|nr:Chromosome 16 80 [Perkinsus chesapeaki]
MPTAPLNSGSNVVAPKVVTSPKPSAIKGTHFWQNPFVNVMKIFGGKAETRGEVSEELDKDISKRVKRIYGSISANNYIRYPGAKSQGSYVLTGEKVVVEGQEDLSLWYGMTLLALWA